MKSLKKINLSLKAIDYNDISNIEGLNNSIVSAKIKWRNHSNYILYNFQAKFPNLSNLELELLSKESQTTTDIEITENSKFKIKNLNIEIKGNLQLYCQNFGNLETIIIYMKSECKNIKDKFPFFKNNCDIIFSSLNYFSFDYQNKIDIETLDNLFNNLEKMKNLKYLGLSLMCEDIDKNYYECLNKKISLLNLEYYIIDISNGVIIGELLNMREYEERKNINEFKENGICIKKLE